MSPKFSLNLEGKKSESGFHCFHEWNKSKRKAKKKNTQASDNITLAFLRRVVMDEVYTKWTKKF